MARLHQRTRPRRRRAGRRGDFAAAFAGTLDNAAEFESDLVRRRPRAARQRSGATLIAAGFRAYGESLPGRLRGIFAGVVTDGIAGIRLPRPPRLRRRSSTAMTRDGFYAATEAKQVVAGAGIPHQPDLDVVERIFFNTYDDDTPLRAAGSSAAAEGARDRGRTGRRSTAPLLGPGGAARERSDSRRRAGRAVRRAHGPGGGAVPHRPGRHLAQRRDRLAGRRGVRRAAARRAERAAAARAFGRLPALSLGRRATVHRARRHPLRDPAAHVRATGQRPRRPGALGRAGGRSLSPQPRWRTTQRTTGWRASSGFEPSSPASTPSSSVRSTGTSSTTT